MNRLFISKEVNELLILPSYCENHQLSLESHSFLRFEPVAFPAPPDYDVLFFSSPRSVTHFFEQAVAKSSAAIAAAGTQTARLLEQLGMYVAFVPDHSGDTLLSAQSFAQWVGTRTVFFPISDRSNKSYAQFLPPTQVFCSIVYKTLIESRNIPESDVYVFTSPSNVSGFFSANKLPKSAQVIAWGTSTRNALIASGHSPQHTLQDADEAALILILQQLLA